MTLRPGQIIGEYRLVSFLGAGGMGDVYRAEHVRLGRAAVVKVLKQIDAGGLAWKRFFNEARIQAELNHPNIAVLYGYYDSGVTPCIIMEYVDGLTLDAILQRDGRMSPENAVAFFAKIVATVGYIHKRGIIHRDIKPNNIKITSAGEVKLLDFGISKASFSQNLTTDGKCIGTDRYLAPEQLSGQSASVASDIWALGALLYEMVTGRQAFEGETWADLYKVIRNATYTPPSAFVPEVSPELERIIAVCLKKHPSQRYASADLLLDAVQAVCPAPSPSAGSRPHGASPRLPTLPRIPRSWLLWGAVAVGVLAFVLGGYVVFLEGDEPTVSRSPARPAATVSLAAQGTERPAAAPAVLRTVRINVLGNPAKLFLGTEKGLLGEAHTTPYSASYPKGTHLYFELQRPGYKICSGEFTVRESTEANNYMYQLCKTTESCPESGCK